MTNIRFGSTTSLSFSVLSLVIALGTAACGSTVVRGGGSDSDADALNNKPPACAPNCNPNEEEEPTALALLASQMPWYGDIGSDVDPNMLYLIVGKHGSTCSDPYGSYECGSELKWFASIGLPPDLQKSGVISLAEPGLISSFSVTGPADEFGSCWGGGGSFMDGTIEITSIDDTQVSFVLANTSDFDFDADGSYTAARCP